jgi:DNA-binding transcriptional MerR regulator
MYYPERDMDKDKGRMYYDGNSGSGDRGSGSNGTRYYSQNMVRDPREGKSYRSRKMYMESKEMHKDKAEQLRELEKYMQELTGDMVEMIEDASPEDRQYLEKRIMALADKIGKMNG